MEDDQQDLKLEVDWTLTPGVITPVRFQSREQGFVRNMLHYHPRGSEATEAEYNLKNQHCPVTLSCQQLYNQFGARKSKGGFEWECLNHIRDFGVCKEDECPWTGEHSPRKFERKKGTKRKRNEKDAMVMKIEDFIGDWRFSLSELPYMLNARPIMGSIEETEEFRDLQKGVIYKTSSSQINPNHIVLIVGYGIDPISGKKFFKIKNLWGIEWCDNGFGLVDEGALVEISYVVDAKMVPRGEGTIRINIAGFVDKNNKTSFGGLVRGRRGKWVEGFYGLVNDSSKIKAELSSIHQALELCHTKKWFEVPIETACNDVVDLLKTAKNNHREWNIIKKCRALQRNTGASINTISAAEYSYAHIIATDARTYSKKGLKMKLEDPPKAIRNQLIADLQRERKGDDYLGATGGANSGAN